MNTQSLKCDRFISMTSISTAVECYMSTRGGAKIDKLLSLSSSCTVEGTESLSGEAIIRGKVNHRAIYLDENESLRTMDYTSDFSTKVSNALITPTTTLICMPEVVDSEVSTRSDSEIKVTSAICIQLYAIVSDEYEVFGIDDSLVLDLDTISPVCMVGKGSSDLLSSEGISIGENVGSVLLVENNLSISSSISSRDKVTVSGEVYSLVTYESDNKVSSRKITIPFSEEIFVDGAIEGDDAISLGYIKSTRINLSGEGADTSLEVECAISLKTFALRTYEREVVKDCFSTTHVTEVDSIMLPYGIYLDTFTHDERLNASVEQNADQISCTSTRNVYVSSVVASEGFVRVEGVMDIDVVSMLEGRYICNTVEIPYSLNIPAPKVDTNTTVLAKISVKDISSSIRNGRIDITIDMRVLLTLFAEDSALVVKNVLISNEEHTLAPLMMKRLRNGENMWDVCKQMCASAEDILAQNPEVSIPLVADEVIKYYRHVEV